MSTLRRYARNLSANWFGYVANLAAMFLMTPFVFSCLEKELYGVWSLLVSVTGYLGLVELGTRASLGRHINFYLGRRDIGKVNGLLNTALVFFAASGLLLLIASSAVGLFFTDIFPKVTPQWLGEIRISLALITLALWLSLFNASFRQIVIARERFDIATGIDLAVLAIRVGGTVWVLNMGWGILGLATLQVVLSVVGIACNLVVALRVQEGLRIDLALARREDARELLSFGIWAFVAGIAMQVLYVTDTLIIGIVFDEVAVAFYAIPLILISNSRGIVMQITKTVTPRAFQSSGRGDLRDLRFLVTWGFRASMMIAIPLYLGLAFFGTEFLHLWLPEEYDYQLGGIVLILLAIPQVVARSVEMAGGVINGLGHVRFGATMTALQGAVNIALTLVFILLLKMGLPGVALGTLVPMILFSIVSVTAALRWIEYPGWAFMRTVLLPGLAACALVSGLYWAVVELAPWSSRMMLFLPKVLALGGAAIVLSFLVLFSGREKRELLSRVVGAVRGGSDSTPSATEAPANK